MMNEKECKKLISEDLTAAKGRIEELLVEIENGDADLVDISFSLEKIERIVESAKDRLSNCEDY